jgi:hypothetical protein
LKESGYITKEASVITTDVRVEGIVHLRERVGSQGTVDGHLSDPKVVAGRSHVDAQELLHSCRQVPRRLNPRRERGPRNYRTVGCTRLSHRTKMSRYTFFPSQ